MTQNEELAHSACPHEERDRQMAKQAKDTFTHRTSTGSAGEIMYDAPVEIHDQQDLDNYHITWKECITLRFGEADRRTVYMIRTPKRELAEYLWHELNNDHVQKVRNTRCMIPGKQRMMNRCPTNHSCAECPYGKEEEKRQNGMLSWDQLTEDAYEREWSDDRAENICEETGSFLLLLDELQEELDRYDPRLMSALKMKEIAGYSAGEIAAALECSQARVYQLLKAAKKIAREWLKE